MVDESVAHNLTLGESIPDEQIRAALRAANALQFVEAMPDGLADACRARVDRGCRVVSGSAWPSPAR